MPDMTRVWVKATGQPKTIPTTWLDYPALMRPYSLTEPASPNTPPANASGGTRVVTEPKRRRHTDTTTEPPAAGDEKE